MIFVLSRLSFTFALAGIVCMGTAGITAGAGSVLVGVDSVVVVEAGVGAVDGYAGVAGVAGVTVVWWVVVVELLCARAEKLPVATKRAAKMCGVFIGPES